MYKLEKNILAIKIRGEEPPKATRRQLTKWGSLKIFTREYHSKEHRRKSERK